MQRKICGDSVDGCEREVLVVVIKAVVETM